MLSSLIPNIDKLSIIFLYDRLFSNVSFRFLNKSLFVGRILFKNLIYTSSSFIKSGDNEYSIKLLLILTKLFIFRSVIILLFIFERLRIF